MQGTDNNIKQKRSYRKSEVTREIIYQTTIEMMSKQGFQGTTIRDICKQANIPIGTFYNCFKSKSDILRDIYSSADAFFLDVVSKELEGRMFMEQLRLFTVYYAKLNTDTGLDLMRVLYNPENEWFTLSRPMQDIMQGIFEKGKSEGVIRTDLTSKRLTENVFGVLRGICYTWCIYNASFNLEERMLENLNILIEGIKKR